MKFFTKFLALIVVFMFTGISSEAYSKTNLNLRRSQPQSRGVISSLKNGLSRMASDSGARVKVHAGTSAYRAGKR